PAVTNASTGPARHRSTSARPWVAPVADHHSSRPAALPEIVGAILSPSWSSRPDRQRPSRTPPQVPRTATRPAPVPPASTTTPPATTQQAGHAPHRTAQAPPFGDPYATSTNYSNLELRFQTQDTSAPRLKFVVEVWAVGIAR